jgi:hypothetical protein
MHKYLQHQTSFIRYTRKYDLLVYLFDYDIIIANLIKVRQV